MVKTEKALDYLGRDNFRCLAQSANIPLMSLKDFWRRAWPVMGFPGSASSSARLLDLTCPYQLWRLPSTAGSPSLLHLRTLAPQRHAASSWHGTVEPQPPPHAHSVVAWPVARREFYGRPTNPLSQFWPAALIKRKLDRATFRILDPSTKIPFLVLL